MDILSAIIAISTIIGGVGSAAWMILKLLVVRELDSRLTGMQSQQEHSLREFQKSMEKSIDNRLDQMERQIDSHQMSSTQRISALELRVDQLWARRD